LPEKVGQKMAPSAKILSDQDFCRTSWHFCHIVTNISRNLL